ncbi:MAG: hypothetical protein EXR58_07800 [Chloroflexi bacterium]|nr:hypothetical protein [Chloroflexota bacterium]
MYLAAHQPSVRRLPIASAMAGLLGLIFASVAAAQGTTVMVSNNASVGAILTDANGMTLYTHASDDYTSNCYEACATNWPPLLVTDDPIAPDGLAGELATTTRTDGNMQVIYNDQPLYRFTRDTQRGQAGGVGINAFGGLWSAATASMDSTVKSAPVAPTTDYSYDYPDY